MILIPAIDLRSGKVVRLFQGDYSQETVYGENPLSYAKRFVQLGARRLHIVDLDGAKVGSPVHRDLILSIVKEVDVPVQVGGGLRSPAHIEDYLAQGVSQVIIGTKAVEDFSAFRDLCSSFPRKIIVSVDIRGEYVAVSGWLKLSSINYLEFLSKLNELPLFAVILTLIEQDGTQGGIALKPLERALEVAKHPLIVAGGVASLTDLMLLNPLSPKGLLGVISGRAIYEGSLDFKLASELLNT